jgi:hypothetical protein
MQHASGHVFFKISTGQTKLVNIPVGWLNYRDSNVILLSLDGLEVGRSRVCARIVPS